MISKTALESVTESIFSIHTPDGAYTLNMPLAKTTSDKSYIIDSGAAVSVAPYGTFKNVQLNKDTKRDYKLQNASGKELNIYGTKRVPFKLGKSTFTITVVICDVTQPLLSTNDLNNEGVTVVLSKNNPHIISKIGSLIWIQLTNV